MLRDLSRTTWIVGAITLAMTLAACKSGGGY
jgi:hypothetical protein